VVGVLGVLVSVGLDAYLPRSISLLVGPLVPVGLYAHLTQVIGLLAATLLPRLLSASLEALIFPPLLTTTLLHRPVGFVLLRRLPVVAHEAFLEF
jgi:hypothetical protein